MECKMKESAINKRLNAREAEVLYSAFVLLLGFCARLNFCAFNPACVKP